MHPRTDHHIQAAEIANGANTLVGITSYVHEMVYELEPDERAGVS